MTTAESLRPASDEEWASLIDPTGRPTMGRDSSVVATWFWTYLGGVLTEPVSKVKSNLNEYVDAVSVTHEQVTITKHGVPAAVLIGADEWEAIQETLFWLSQPGIQDSIAEADADIEAGRTLDEDQVRARFHVPRRDG